jgi:glutamine synthetase adenylyltransferase
MLELNARELIELIHDLLASEHAIRGKSGVLTPMLAATRDQANDKVIELLRNLELPQSLRTAEEMVAGARTIERLHEGLTQLWNNVALELDGRKLFAPLSKYIGYFEQVKALR